MSSEATNVTDTFSQSIIMISDEFPDGSLTISSEDTNETEIQEERPAEKKQKPITL